MSSHWSKISARREHKAVDKMDLFLPDRVKSVFFNLDISDSLYDRVPLIYLAQLSLVFEKIKKKRKCPYAFTRTAQTTTVLVTRAVYTLPKWQFASTRTHLH